MEGSSPFALPTVASVGSLLGLKPYSSISFRRMSSAFLRSFRLRQNHNAARTRRTTATIGTTVATAMVLVLVLGPLELWPLGVARPLAPVEAAAAMPVPVELDDCTTVCWIVLVEVRKTVVAAPLGRVAVVTKEVVTRTLREVTEGALEDVEGEDDEVVSIEMMLEDEGGSEVVAVLEIALLMGLVTGVGSVW